MAALVAIRPIIVGVDRFQQEPVPYYATVRQSRSATVRQLVGYCDGRLTKLDRDFPESDLVKFMARQGM